MKNPRDTYQQRGTLDVVNRDMFTPLSEMTLLTESQLQDLTKGGKYEIYSLQNLNKYRQDLFEFLLNKDEITREIEIKKSQDDFSLLIKKTIISEDKSTYNVFLREKPLIDLIKGSLMAENAPKPTEENVLSDSEKQVLNYLQQNIQDSDQESDFQMEDLATKLDIPTEELSSILESLEQKELLQYGHEEDDITISMTEKGMNLNEEGGDVSGVKNDDDEQEGMEGNASEKQVKEMGTPSDTGANEEPEKSELDSIMGTDKSSVTSEGMKEEGPEEEAPSSMKEENPLVEKASTSEKVEPKEEAPEEEAMPLEASEEEAMPPKEEAPEEEAPKRDKPPFPEKQEGAPEGTESGAPKEDEFPFPPKEQEGAPEEQVPQEPEGAKGEAPMEQEEETPEYSTEELEKFAQETETSKLEAFLQNPKISDNLKQVAQVTLAKRKGEDIGIIQGKGGGPGDENNNGIQDEAEKKELSKWMDAHFESHDKEDLAKYVKDLAKDSPSKMKDLKEAFRENYSKEHMGNVVENIDNNEFDEFTTKYMNNLSFGDLKEYCINLVMKNPNALGKLKKNYKDLKDNGMID